MLKHNLFAIGTTILWLIAALAHAEAPMAHSQVPGYYRIQVGKFEVTALYDGAIVVDAKLLKNTNAADLQRRLFRMFVDNPKMQTAVNAYLINTGTHVVLIDTGAGKLFGSYLGFMQENMKTAGYHTAQVDTVVLTHLHGDHMGGLVDSDGKPVFPKAKILAPKEDNDYWLSQEIADAAPAEHRRYFKMARDVAAPYIASGQWGTFSEGSMLSPGISAVDAYGHTPGHTAYAIESDGQKLLIWGDVVHAHAIQFARPGVSIEYDSDQTQAIATRRSLMNAMASSESLVAGMHLPFPGIGHVRADGPDSFSWVPIELRPYPGVTKQ
ncbi:MAG: MBL fold metallo-hydrolase [Candidatus Thiodiazotropha sp.]